MGDPVALAAYHACKNDLHTVGTDSVVRTALWSAYHDVTFPSTKGAVARLGQTSASALGIDRSIIRPIVSLPLPAPPNDQARGRERDTEPRASHLKSPRDRDRDRDPYRAQRRPSPKTGDEENRGRLPSDEKEEDDGRGIDDGVQQ